MIAHDLLAALPALAVRALVESALVGALLGGAVWLVVDKLAPMRAAARHTVWSLALVAIAALPLASIVSSLAHVNRVSAQTTAAGTYEPSQRATRIATSRQVSPATARAMRVPRQSPHLPSLTIPESIALAALIVWALGAAAGFVVLGASIWRVHGLKRRSSPLEGSLAGELPWLTDAHAREIYLRLSYEIETPVAIGFGRPVILIPTELAMNDGLGAIEDLVMHEHAHLRRYDDYTNLMQRVLERLFWFNPIVWLVGKRIALEREIASDDCVVAQTGHAAAYAESLWRLAKEMRMPEHAIVAPGAMLTRKQITIRIEQLLDAKRDLLPRLSPAALITLGIGSALAILTMTLSAPAIELPASAVTANRPTPVRTKPDDVPKPGFVVGDTRKTIALQDLPVLPKPIVESAPRVRRDETHRESEQIILGDETERGFAAAAERAVHEAILDPLPAPIVVPPTPLASPARPLAIHLHPAIPDINIEIADIEISPHSASATLPTSGPLPADILASCIGCNFAGRNLSGIDLSHKALNGLNLRGANLRGANLSGATLVGVDLRGANLDNADLRNARLTGASLIGASLNDAQLGGISLVGLTLGQLHLTSGQMSRDLLRACSGCDLRGANLRGADLHGLNMTGADMRGVDLSGADLHDVQFEGVDLREAKLIGANLHDAHLTGCDLRDARMHGANVSGASFARSNISEGLF